ncbi:FG-GAP-like repeat-containing protein [Novosphingobium sp. AAP83]|uniref:beta strand repeat-containing protein n=1 Tax=Novosphingobium sp. AAP83 TaxID=1523425 RepID=UPI000A531975|nr:FG-GAP-like repeat-containing protein [Novosphingobium sp. AAP83]
MARFVGLETADVLIGGADADEVIGNGGNDTLSGGAGADTLTGGQGSDRFIDTTANLNGDTITDFSADDVIVLSDAAPLNGFVEFTGGTLNYAGMSLALPGLAPGVFGISPFVTGGVALTYYNQRSITAPSSVTNSVLTYGGISLDGTGITLTNTASGRIFFRPVTMNQGGNAFVNETGGQVDQITGSSGDDVIINRGTIFGSITLSDGRDTLITSGSAGTRDPVNLGGGDDTLRIEGGLNSLNAEGGIGVDTATIAITSGQFFAHGLTGFEHAVIETSPGFTSNINGLSGYQAISILPASNFALANLIDSFNPQVDLSIAGSNTSLVRSSFRSIIGGAQRDYLSLNSGTAVSGAVLLDAGDDFLSFDVFSTGAVAIVGGAVDGGAGLDTAEFNIFTAGQSRSVDLANFTGFEKLNFNSSYVLVANWTASNVDAGVADIRVGQLIGLTLNSSTLASTNLDAVHGTRLVIGADSLVASIKSANAELFDLQLDTPQGDVRSSSSILVNGSVTGDIVMAQGDDVVDASSGSVGGKIFGNGGNDTLTGGAGVNQLIGGFGNDVLQGGAGNDVLDGGPGIDTASFAVTRAQATIVRSGNGSLTITAGADGTDTIANVEKLQFADGLFAVNRFADPGTPRVANFAAGAGGWSSQDRFPRMAADVNGDGLADIVGFGQAGTLVALGQAGGTFAAPVTAVANFGVDQGWSSDNIFRREMADVNNDGRADIVGFGFAGVLVSLAQANGTFGAATLGSSNFNPANGWTTQDSFARTLADVNGDGFADIVGFGVAGTFVSLGTGTGSFGTASLALNNFGANQGWSSNNVFHREVGDVNGDGHADIVGFGAAGTLVALGQANGTFAAATLALGNFGTNQGWSTQDVFTRDLADVNGDGRDDIVGFGVAGTFVAYGLDNGTFSTAAFDLANFGRDQGWSSDNTFHRELADVNGDGFADIVGFGFGGVFVASAFDGLVL